MEATHKSYNHGDSLTRIEEILDSADNNYEEKNDVPSRSGLTFTNGYYVNCTALFVDICNSSDLPNKHTRPVLAKIYRSFISEMVALFNSCDLCREVNIHGDCVWGVFNTPLKSDIESCLVLAAKANSLVKNINKRLEKKGYTTYEVGIGMDYGRALMIKAGHKGSAINDVVWMGDVVNQACHLASYGNESYYDKTIMISKTIYNNLDDESKSLFDWNYNLGCYHGNVIWKYWEEE